MTTTVKVEAHCSSNIQVKLILEDPLQKNRFIEEITLQSGEKAERYVSGKQSITVYEEEKK